jgi:hypothetical protein
LSLLRGLEQQFRRELQFAACPPLIACSRLYREPPRFDQEAVRRRSHHDHAVFQLRARG